MSFLDKLKSRVNEDVKEEKREEAKIPADLAQLDVDIYENSSDITIYAPVPGASIEDLDISMEDEGDVVIIQGKRNIPAPVEGQEKSQCLRQECHWGGFFRQIILPQEININEVDAKLHNGILILKLPLLRLTGKGMKKIPIHNEEKEKIKK